MLGEVAAAMNELPVQASRLDDPQYYGNISLRQLSELIARTLDGTINQRTAKGIFLALWNGEGESADAIIDAQGLRQISDTSAIEKIVDEVLAANAQSVAEFRAGKDKALNSLVGQAMKATKGKANPQQVNEILRRRLSAN
jgi:aspartyl-tRNA(Asn)/glutamyl-tRNA(Gln) amidotransferase subunit B